MEFICPIASLNSIPSDPKHLCILLHRNPLNLSQLLVTLCLCVHSLLSSRHRKNRGRLWLTQTQKRFPSTLKCLSDDYQSQNTLFAYLWDTSSSDPMQIQTGWQWRLWTWHFPSALHDTEDHIHHTDSWNWSFISWLLKQPRSLTTLTFSHNYKILILTIMSSDLMKRLRFSLLLQKCGPRTRTWLYPQSEGRCDVSVTELLCSASQ